MLENPDLSAAILAKVNELLSAEGLKVNKARGAIIDASIIESASRPNRMVDVDEQGDAKVSDSADPDARSSSASGR